MFKLDIEKAEETKIKLPTNVGSLKKQEHSRRASASLTTLKHLTVWITTNCGKFLNRWEHQTTLPASWETCIQVKKQPLEPDMEQQTGSKLGKEYVKAVYCHCLFNLYAEFSSVQSLSCVQLFATPWITARQASLSNANTRSPPKPMPIESMISSNHLVLCCPLLLLPPIPPSIRVFSNESTLHRRWPKDWSFSFSISPPNKHSGSIFFRIDRLDLLAVQGTLKSLLQHHSSKASILQRSAFFTVQLSHPYMTIRNQKKCWVG